MIVSLVLLLLIGLLISGIPIFAALGLTGSIILFVAEGSFSSIGDTVFSTLNKSILTTIPLFVFMAQVMIRAEIVDDIFDMANKMVGHIRGGLGVATVFSCTVFASISGSSVATALSIGSSAIPQMKRYGYSSRQSCGVVAAGGTLGILIPPSGPMILYAIVSDASIGALFVAGLVPGIMLALIFALNCVLFHRAEGPVEGKRQFAGWHSLLHALKRSLWAVMMPPLVLSGIYLGVFTASEAAAIGSLYALAVAVLVYRNFSLADLWQCTQNTMHVSMMVFAIIVAAAIFGHAITVIRIPAEISEAVSQMGLSQTGFILVVMAMVMLLGMFLESIAIILITTPILLPTIVALDISPVWYGIMLMINLELAMITPPVGMNLFAIKGISDASLIDIIRGAAPFVALMILGLFLILIFPEIALWLPRLAGFDVS